MVPSTDAQRIGMVDEVLPEDQVLERAIEEAKKWARYVLYNSVYC